MDSMIPLTLFSKFKIIDGITKQVKVVGFLMIFAIKGIDGRCTVVNSG